MTFTVRPCVIPDDCVDMAAISSAVNPEPVTAEQLENQYRAMPADAVVHMLLAVSHDSRPVGYGAVRHLAHEAPGRFHIRALTPPDCRRQGVGGLLYDQLEALAREHGATLLETYVRDNDPLSLAFAQKRGFATDRHAFESRLDLATFDEARFAGTTEAVKAGGIRFFSLADDPAEENLRRFYDLVWLISSDLPGYTFASPPPYELWAAQVLKGPKVRQDLLLIAAEGDRWVGFNINVVSPANGSIYNGGTGVDRDYRGRSIALALKLEAIRRARASGAPYMRTNNDSQNAPMLAVNRKLGYQPSPGIYEMLKQLQ
jgi:GNAT superfamily N-acetyltransferase